MAGHSKWANIKHRKEKADAKKGKIFSRVSKEIINAVKHGGSDQKANQRLKVAIQKAKSVNFPADNIDRVIKKASNADQMVYHEMQYELYGFGGVGLVVDIMTDNKNRIASDIRVATNKRGGTIAVPGAVTFNFERKGILVVAKENVCEEALFAAAMEAKACDFSYDEESRSSSSSSSSSEADLTQGCFIITVDPTDLYFAKEALEKHTFIISEAEIHMIAKSLVEVDEEIIKANLALIEWLEGIDDVDAVYHNMNLC